MEKDQEKLLSLKDASKNSPYSADYLSLLIRKGKLEGFKQDGKWFTTQKALKRYLSKVAEASYERQEVLNVKIPAAENKLALVNLKWALILAVLIFVVIATWNIAEKSSDSVYQVEKDANNNLIIRVDDPDSIKSVTVVPK